MGKPVPDFFVPNTTMTISVDSIVAEKRQNFITIWMDNYDDFPSQWTELTRPQAEELREWLLDALSDHGE